MKQAVYKILGSDGEEYGPITSGQLKQWIAESRVEKRTPIFPESGDDWIFLESLPEFAALFDADGAPLRLASPQEAQSASGRPPVTRPGNNPLASVAYYLGVLSLIPIAGALPGIAAFALGILGLNFRRRHPEAGGAKKAWTGILLGCVFGFGYLALILLLASGRIVHRHPIH